MGKAHDQCDVLSGIVQDQCIDVVTIDGIVHESCQTSWEGFREEFGNLPEYKIREYRECV